MSWVGLCHEKSIEVHIDRRLDLANFDEAQNRAVGIKKRLTRTCQTAAKENSKHFFQLKYNCN